MEGSTVKLEYFPDTDTLFIGLSSQMTTDSEEVSEGVVFDYGTDGKLTGIEIELASQKLDLTELMGDGSPTTLKTYPG
jgi:uncharacterized protein YuzE